MLYPWIRTKIKHISFWSCAKGIKAEMSKSKYLTDVYKLFVNFGFGTKFWNERDNTQYILSACNFMANEISLIFLDEVENHIRSHFLTALH
jgi:hypothetical protein